MGIYMYIFYEEKPYTVCLLYQVAVGRIFMTKKKNMCMPPAQLGQPA